MPTKPARMAIRHTQSWRAGSGVLNGGLNSSRIWKSLLLRNGLTYIHAVDLKQGKKQFKDKIRWPERRRLALAQEAGQLALDHSMFSHTVLLKNSDYDIHYIGGDRKLRKHRAPIDSKYGVCVRVFLSQLTEFVRRYGEEDTQVTVILRARWPRRGTGLG